MNEETNYKQYNMLNLFDLHKKKEITDRYFKNSNNKLIGNNECIACLIALKYLIAMIAL